MRPPQIPPYGGGLTLKFLLIYCFAGTSRSPARGRSTGRPFVGRPHPKHSSAGECACDEGRLVSARTRRPSLVPVTAPTSGKIRGSKYPATVPFPLRRAPPPNVLPRPRPGARATNPASEPQIPTPKAEPSSYKTSPAYHQRAQTRTPEPRNDACTVDTGYSASHPLR